MVSAEGLNKRAKARKLITMKSKLLFSALFVAFLGIANISMAQDGFAKNHPRRSEVNKRLQDQDRRINHEMRNGDISRRQANHLHQRDHHIWREERRMAFRHDGHITRHEQSRLYRQENHMSRRIDRA
jgi:hypothetical protein